MSDIKPPTPMLSALEARAPLEAGQLMLALPLLRLHAKRGNGEPVMVLPGFMASDRSTVLLRNYLNSIGYRAYPWELGTNRKPLVTYLPVLRDRLRELDEGKGVTLIGWSRGGIISRELARDYPDLVPKVITIGSPVKGGVAVSSIGRWVQRETGLSPQQMRQLTEDRSRVPIKVPVRAIYSRTDGVVAWKACIDEETENIKHYEIIGSHVGMGANVEVFRLLPELLAESP